MIVLRLLVLFALIAIGASIVVYFFSRDKRYLNLAWRIFRFAVVFLLIFAAFFILERLVLI